MPEKKRILVTGAGTRLGKTITTRLHHDGYVVIPHYHTSKKATQVLADKLHLETPYKADLTNKEETDALFKHCGTIDGVIHTPGSFIYKPLSETSIEEFESCIANNLFTSWACAKYFLSDQSADAYGRLIFFGSVGCDQLTSRPKTTPYYIGKTGLLMLVKSLAQEQQHTNTTINMISPGVLPTGVHPDPTIPIIPFDAIANAVLFLLKEESGHVNGANIAISKGWRPGT